MASFTVLGGPELMAQLSKLADAVELRISLKAVRAATSMYRQDMMKGLPKTDGIKLRAWKIDERKTKSNRKNLKVAGDIEDVHLWRSLAIKRNKQAGKRVASYRLGITGLARAYAHVWEFGGKYHTGNRLFTKTLRNNTGKYYTEMKRKASEELIKEAARLPKVKRQRFGRVRL